MEAIAWVLGIGVGLYLLFRFTKPMLIVVGILVGLAALVVSGFWASGELAKVERSRIAIVVRYDTTGGCEPTHPLLISFKNNSNKTLNYVSFSVHGKRPGYSRDAYSDYLLSSDKILPPGSVHFGCWGIRSYQEPDEPLGLEWAAEVSTVSFE